MSKIQYSAFFVVLALSTSFPAVSDAQTVSVDFAVTQTTASEVSKNSPLYYTVTATNMGPVAASAKITSDFPSNATYVSAPGCTYTSTTVTCPTGVLASGASKSFLIKYSTFNTPCNATVTHVVRVTSAVNDPNTSNNTASIVAKVTCIESDFSITKTVSSQAVQKGTPIYYTLTATNNGPKSGKAVISDNFPSGVVYVSAPGCSYTSTAVSCPTGPLASGQTKSFLVKFATTNTPCNTVVSNVATVSSGTDSNAANNTSVTVTTNVQCPSDTAPQLFITTKSMATTDAAVQNQKAVRLIRFEVFARDADTLFTDAIFDAAKGNLMNAYNYTLRVDTDDDGVVDTNLQTGVSAQGGQVRFAALAGGGYVIPQNSAVVFEVLADMSSSFVSGSTELQLKFATSAVDYVAAELVTDGTPIVGIRTNGVCSFSCQITVVTAPSTIFNLKNQGDLYVNKSSTPVRSRQLLGGTLSDEIMRLQFHAEYEDIDVSLLRFSTIDHDVVSVDRLELFQVGSTTPFAVATKSACGSGFAPGTFCAAMQNQQFLVAKGSNTNILVRARMKADSEGAVSGELVQVAILGSMQQPTVEARGLLSSNTLVPSDGDSSPEGEIFLGQFAAGPDIDIVGSRNVAVLSKIATITNADPNANGTAIPTGVGRQIAQFKFATASANNPMNGTNKWTLSGLIFNVNATNVLLGFGDQSLLATSDFKIYNKADPFSKRTCTANKVTASGSNLVVTCSNISIAMDAEINPGEDRTFVLEAAVVNSKIINAAASTLQVSLSNFGNMSVTGFGLSQSHMQWLDKDNGAATFFLWIEYPDTVINGTQYQG